MVDGTAEFLYYMLLTPFSFNRVTLLWADYITGALLCWGCVALLWSLLSQRNSELKLLLLMGFSFFIPVIKIFASGFGNGLIGFVFLLIVYYQIRGKNTKSFLLASLLPLIRPDAVFYSGAVFFVGLIRRYKGMKRYIFFTLMNALLYFGLVRVFYGHWIPTPMSFKGRLDHALTSGQLLELARSFTGRFEVFTLAPLLLIAAIAFFLWLRRYAGAGIRTLYYYIAPLLGIFLFFYFFVGDSGRYTIGIKVFFVVFALLLIDDLANRPLPYGSPRILDLPRALTSNRRTFLYMTASLLCGIIVLMALSDSGLLRGKPIHRNLSRYRLDALGVGGQIIDDIVPMDWTIGAVEMCTFGYMTDREVMDFYGYTTPAIAQSKIYNDNGQRSNPDFFIAAKPDIVWIRTDPKEEPALVGFPHKEKDVEAVLTGWRSFNRRANIFGDMTDLMSRYDLVFLNTQDWVSTLLVRRDMTGQMSRLLKKRDYELVFSRAIDMDKMKKYLSDKDFMRKDDRF